MIQQHQYILVGVLLCLFSSISISQEKSDVIHLKSGGKVIGTILDTVEHQSVHMKLQSARILEIPLKDIDTITTLLIVPSAGSIQISQSTAVYRPSHDSRARDTAWVIQLRSGAVYSYRTLDSLQGTSLFVSNHSVVDTVNITMIKELRLERTSHTLLYSFGGAIAGGIIGGAVASSSNDDQKTNTAGDIIAPISHAVKIAGGILIGGLIGLTAGLVWGVIHGADYVVDMPENNLSGQKQTILQLFQQ